MLVTGQTVFVCRRGWLVRAKVIDTTPNSGPAVQVEGDFPTSAYPSIVWVERDNIMNVDQVLLAIGNR